MRDNTTFKERFFKIGQHLSQIMLIYLILFGFNSTAVAASLSARIDQFPQWINKPSLKLAKGDLEYPQWMAGTWNVTSTLTEQIAPLAPNIVTPGFEDNQQYLDQAIAFQVRFGTEYYIPSKGLMSAFKSEQLVVVADRAFNGTKIAEAYLGDDNVYKRKLISKITGRGREIPTDRQFIATEVTQQLFRSPERLYLNEVETTSSYRLLDSGHISAEQMTAIYLSPQDPDYFTAGARPVALYRYHLTMNNQQ
jgi:hypothetical protein